MPDAWRLLLDACSLVLGPGAIANGQDKSWPLVILDDGSRYILHVCLIFIDNNHASFSLDPYFGATTERLIRAVNHAAGTVDLYLMTVVICLISFNGDHWFAITALSIAFNYMLVDVYIFFTHLFVLPYIFLISPDPASPVSRSLL